MLLFEEAVKALISICCNLQINVYIAFSHSVCVYGEGEVLHVAVEIPALGLGPDEAVEEELNFENGAASTTSTSMSTVARDFTLATIFVALQILLSLRDPRGGNLSL